MKFHHVTESAFLVYKGRSYLFSIFFFFLGVNDLRFA